MPFTHQEKYEELERELKMRKQVFDRLVANGNLSPETAKRRIAIMQEIADDYAKLAALDRLL
jgi:hypothetical protein